METNENENIVDLDETNEEAEENTEEKSVKADKPKRSPQEEYDYYMGRAKRIAKKHGFGSDDVESPKSSQPDKPSEELDYGEKAYLRSALNLKGADELQLAKEWKKKYQATAEEMETDEVFLTRLDKLRKARASDDATPKGGKRGTAPSGDEFAAAMAKYMDTGELPEDRNLREKVVEARIAKESSNKMFYNS